MKKRESEKKQAKSVFQQLLSTVCEPFDGDRQEFVCVCVCIFFVFDIKVAYQFYLAIMYF